MDPTRPCPSRTVWLTEVRRPSHSRWCHSLGWDPTLYIRGKAEFVTLFFLTVDPLWPTPSTSSLWRTGTSVSFLPGGYFPRVCYQQKSQSRKQKNVSGEGGESISVILVSHKLSLRLTFSFLLILYSISESEVLPFWPQCVWFPFWLHLCQGHSASWYRHRWCWN